MGTRDQKFLKLPKNSFMHIQTPAGVWNDLPVVQVKLQILERSEYSLCAIQHTSVSLQPLDDYYSVKRTRNCLLFNS